MSRERDTDETRKRWEMKRDSCKELLPAIFLKLLKQLVVVIILIKMISCDLLFKWQMHTQTLLVHCHTVCLDQLLEQILVTNWKHKQVHMKTDVMGVELGPSGDVSRFGELKNKDLGWLVLQNATTGQSLKTSVLKWIFAHQTSSTRWSGVLALKRDLS